MGTNGMPIFTQPYKTKIYEARGGSIWSRAPRGSQDPEEVRCWGENCEMEKHVRDLSLRQLGKRVPKIQFPPPGKLTNDLPEHLVYLQPNKVMSWVHARFSDSQNLIWLGAEKKAGILKTPAILLCKLILAQPIQSILGPSRCVPFYQPQLSPSTSLPRGCCAW